MHMKELTRDGLNTPFAAEGSSVTIFGKTSLIN